MRIPIPIVLILCTITVATTWWLGTRHKDFLTPPDSIEVRQPAHTTPSEPPVREDPTLAQPLPVIPKEAKDSLVALDTFADQAAMGTPHLRDLATNMQKAQWPHLAWLAWERIIESENPPAEDLQAARQAIHRLRSTPAGEQRVRFPDKPWKITVHAGTAENQALQMESILKSCSSDIQSIAAPILEVAFEVSRGANPADTDTPTPVAIWISGPDSGSRSSEILSFTFASPEEAIAKTKKTVMRILRGLAAKSMPNPPPPAADSPFQESLVDSFTRRSWNQLGEFLNRPEEESAKPAIQTVR